MRDKRFIAEHRGGPLSKDRHYLLMHWALLCAGHVLHLAGDNPDERLIKALKVAKDWKEGKASVGEARNASVESHATARDSNNPVQIAVARSVGHALATAHMADHSLGAALYALKAITKAGQTMETERAWQNKHLPAEIRELVLTAMAMKESSFKF